MWLGRKDGLIWRQQQSELYATQRQSGSLRTGKVVVVFFSSISYPAKPPSGTPVGHCSYCCMIQVHLFVYWKNVSCEIGDFIETLYLYICCIVFRCAVHANRSAFYEYKGRHSYRTTVSPGFTLPERQEKQQKHKISQLLKFNQHGAENTWNTYFPINSKSHHTHGGIRTPED